MKPFRPLKRRPRRPDDGKFLPRDEKAWRALLRAARYQARAPLANSAALDAAVQRCARAALPQGEARRDSVFMKLLSAARAYGRMVDGRALEADLTLSALADQCEAVLDRAPPPPRADIFG